MATDLNQDAVLNFLCSKNGMVKNSELLNHFRTFLREDENKAQNRELFKKFVNSVAVVKQEEGVSFVLLKKRYMVHVGAVGVASSTKTNSEDGKRSKQGGSSAVERKNAEKKSGHSSSRTLQNSNNILPAAGIVSNVDTVHVENRRKDSRLYALPAPPAVTDTVLNYSTCTSTLPACQDVNVTEKQRDQHSGTFVAATNDERQDVSNIELGHLKVQCSEDKPFYQAQNDFCSAEVGCVREYVVHSTAGGAGNEGIPDLHITTSGCAVSTTPGETSCASSYMESHKAPDDRVFSQVTLKNEDLLKQNEILSDTGLLQQEDSGVSCNLQPHCQNLPEERTCTNGTYSDCHRAGLSASYGNLLLPSGEDVEWLEGLPKEEWVSDEGLNAKWLSGEEGFKVRQMLRRAEESKSRTFLHDVESKVTPWHRSTGNLDDDVPQTVLVPLRPGDHKARSDLRSRLCRSLGADLDKSFQEDATVARKNRLHLLSSSLSINYHLCRPSEISRFESTCVKGTNISTNRCSYFHRSTVVPLDSKEHDWLIKAASGCWTEIYSLFREDPGLLAKRDFISGYTVLHWIAKHGDHRVLNTLSYGVSKAGVNLDIDIKTTCGYTPLHLAAIHGHKKMIRLLVHKFKANTSLRDTSGKKPWHYLGQHGPRDLLELLGAPHKAVDGKTPVSSLDDLPAQPKTASPTVKRHTSVAAYLKHKALLKVQHYSDSFV